LSVQNAGQITPGSDLDNRLDRIERQIASLAEKPKSR
jgi:hypothetical protein